MNRYIIKDFPNYSVDVLKAVVYRKNKPLKASDNGTGYLQVQLYKNNKHNIIHLHHLVYCAKRGLKILPFKQRLKERCKNIHHKDNNPKNNNYSNLELVSFLENQYLRKYQDLPFCLINKCKGGFCFRYQSNGYIIRKYRRDYKYLIRYRDLFLSFYFKDVYKEVKKIEKKYSQNIKRFNKLKT